jgi:prepilin-type N-terminal cleavage/methylation domain-containing protein
LLKKAQYQIILLDNQFRLLYNNKHCTLEKIMNKRGFTLIELIIVMAIISILSYIILPSITTSLQIGHNSADESNLLVLNSTTEFLRTTMKGNDPFEDPDKSSDELMSVLVNKKLLPNKLTPMAAGKKFAWFPEQGKWDYSDASFDDDDDDDDDIIDPPDDEEPPEDEEPPVTGPQPWKSGKEYKQGDEVLHNGSLYEARKDTTSTPGTVNGDWQEITTEYRNFNLYASGDEVIFDGKVFIARGTTFNEIPGLISSPWQEVTDQWRNFNVYKKGDEVVYNGKRYRAKQNREAGADTNPTNPKFWTALK